VPSRTLCWAGSSSRPQDRRATMQLELAFLERPLDPDEGSKGPWDQIDPQAQIAALVLLSRLIAQKLVANSAPESGDE